MSLRDGMEDVRYFLSSRQPCIWVTTYEEEAFIADLQSMLQTQMPNMRLCLWSNIEGLKTMPISVGEKIGDADVRLREIPALFAHMREQLKKPDSNQTIYLLRDLHAMMNDPRTRRAIRDIAEYFQDVYMPIMILSPETLIHDDVARLFRTTTYALPDKTLITDLVDAANTKVQGAIKKGKTQYTPISKDQYPAYAEVLRGLTKLEITNVLLESLIRFKTLNLEFLTDYKIQKIRKSGALGYKKPTATLKDLGGHNALKSWVSEINRLYSKEARALGLPQPKGVILLGAPGNGKTKFAEALAGELKLPLLTLEMSRILSSMVGSSEANMRRAIEMIKASAPCCVILDEVEKAIGGNY